jgi:type II secretory pathway pseudopilin PulG
MAVEKRSQGFSLLEILISVLLVGLSITALVIANSSFTTANATGADISTAEFLIEQIRELTATLPVMDPALTPATWTTLGPEAGESTVASYDDVDDFDGFNSTVLGAPIDAGKNTLAHLAAFSQQVIVQNVSASNFSSAAADGSTDFVRVTVTVSMNGSTINSASWIRARY